jgi:glutathione S-transferase
MATRLFVVHGSHPCASVEKALELKNIPFRRIELPAGSQPLVMTLLFGGRTVPGIRFDDGEKVHGSRAIMRALEARVPEPPLYGSPEIEQAERWGDEVLQPVPRQLLWPAFRASPRSMHAFQDGQRSPKLPMPMVLAAAPLILAIESRVNHVDDRSVRVALDALPGLLDHVDELIAAGVLDGERPNAADLQIAPSIRLLWALEDVRPLIAGRAAERFAFRWFPALSASVPVGSLPAEWIPAPAAATR